MTTESNIYELQIYPELCCDYCNNIIHNHFDCPICGEQYSDSNIYDDMHDALFDKDYRSYDYLECGKCKSKFVPVDTDASYYDYQWKLIDVSNN